MDSGVRSIEGVPVAADFAGPYGTPVVVNTLTGIGYVLKSDGTVAAFGAGAGSVTSVGLTAPSIFSVSGSPITAAGTLALALIAQAANLVFSGPTSGGSATPTFRSLVAADIPTLTLAKISDAGALAALNAVTEALITLADNTTNNVSTTKHGFAPKAPNDATKFLDGTGAYAVPAGTSGFAVTEIVPSTALPAANFVDILSIPASYRSLFLYIFSASSNTATRSVNVRWSSDNGSTFYTDGSWGTQINNATPSAANDTGNLVDHTAMAAADSMIANVTLENYSTPLLPLRASTEGYYNSGIAFVRRVTEVRRFNVLNALRIILNSTGNFDGGTYQLWGVT